MDCLKILTKDFLKMQIKTFVKNIFVILSLFFLGILTFFVVAFLEVNKVLGDIFYFFKKRFQK